MSVALLPLTYDDLFAMPDDGKRRELIGGELNVNPAPRRSHQDISSNLHWIPQQFLRETGSGRSWAHPVDVIVDPNDVVQPDLIVIRQSRLKTYRPKGKVVEPPGIVVEIISPSSQRLDRVGKMALYARFGVPEYWIADPDQMLLTMNLLEAGAYVAVEPDTDGLGSSRASPGLRVDPAEVFSSLEFSDNYDEGSP